MANAAPPTTKKGWLVASMFDSLFSIGNSELMRVFAESITYTPSGGAAVTLQGTVRPEEIDDRSSTIGRQKVFVRTVMIFSDPDNADGGVQSPQIGAAVSIGGKSYHLERYATPNPDQHELHLMRTELIERSRGGYRRGGQ